MIRDVFRLAHQNIIDEYDNLKEIKWEGHKFILEEVQNLMMYRNKKQGVLLQDFGTTCVMCAVRTRGREDGENKKGALHIIFANAGDSIAFISRAQGKLDGIAIDQLVTIHNSDNHEEEERVYLSGSVKADGHYVSPPEHSGFSWAQLAVTRSLGHKFFSVYGIIPDPHIMDYELHKDDRYLIVTSDGVTDVLDSQEIVDLIIQQQRQTSENLQKTTTKLVKYSVNMWKKRFLDDQGKGEAADNTSAIVIDLKKVPSPAEPIRK